MRAADELAEVVAGDVLDDRAAGVRDRAVGEHERDAEQQVARRAEAVAPRAREVAGEAAADGRVAGRIERELLAVGREPRTERREPDAGLDGDREVAGLVREHAVELRERELERRRRRVRSTRAGRRAVARAQHARDSSSTVAGSETLDKRRPSRADACGAARAPRRTGAASAGACPGSRARPGRTRGARRSITARSSRREHQRHRAGLVDADAVLAGDRAAGRDAGVEDRARAQLGPLGLALDGPVVEDERVQVAVAGVEDVADAQAVLDRELLDAAGARRAAASAGRRRPARSSRG